MWARVLRVVLLLVWIVTAAGFGAMNAAPVAAAHEVLPVAVASCTASVQAGDCGLAYDDNETSAWVSHFCDTVGCWLEYDLGAAVEVTHARVYHAISELRVEYSLDGTTGWTAATADLAPGDTQVAPLSAPVAARYWRTYRTTAQAGAAQSVYEFRLYETPADESPQPSASPSPGDDGTAELPVAEFDPYPQLQQCHYPTVGSECVYGQWQYGLPGTEDACGDVWHGDDGDWGRFNPRDVAGRPWISCADGWPGNPGPFPGTADYGACNRALMSAEPAEAGICPDESKGYRTWYIGRAVEAGTLRVLVDHYISTGAITCNPHYSEPSEWDACKLFPMLGGMKLIGIPDEGDGWVMSGSRAKFRGAGPGCQSDAGPPWRWGQSSPSSPDCHLAKELHDHVSDFSFELPWKFTGRLYIRALAEPARNLRSGDCPPINCWGLEDASRAQAMVVRPLYARLTSGYWHNAATAPADEQTPSQWPSCGGSVDQWLNVGVDACWNDEPFSRIGADVRSDPGFEPEASGHSPEECAADPNLYGCQTPGAWAGCTPGSGVLDAVGWLAYIACLMAGLPGAVVGGIGGLFIPNGDFVSRQWESVFETMEQRAPLGYVVEYTGALEAAADAPAATMPPMVLQLQGESIDAGDALQQAINAVAPFRGLIFGAVMVGFLYAMLRWVLAFVMAAPAKGKDDES